MAGRIWPWSVDDTALGRAQYTRDLLQDDDLAAADEHHLFFSSGVDRHSEESHYCRCCGVVQPMKRRRAGLWARQRTSRMFSSDPKLCS